MINKWGVRNFKSILEENLDLAPLTILTGDNSSGKSTFLQSIMVLVQYAKGLKKDDRFPKKGDTFPLEGAFIGDLGEFKHIFCKKANVTKQDSHKIRFECEYELGNEYYFSLTIKEPESENSKSGNEAIIDSLKLGGERKIICGKDVPIVFDDEGNPLKQSKYKNGCHIFFDKDNNEKIICDNQQILYIEDAETLYVYNLLNRVILNKEDAKWIDNYNDFVDKQLLPDDDFEDNHIDSYEDTDFYEGTNITEDDNEYDGHYESDQPIFYSSIRDNPHYDLSRQKVEKNFIIFLRKKIKYLGPLRDDPAWLFEEKSDDDIEIGPKGENTVALIHTLIDNPKVYSILPLKNIDDQIFSNMPLIDALDQWLNYFFETDGIKPVKLDATDNRQNTDHLKKWFGCEFKFGDVRLALAQLGTGISQVLPILVICLTAKQGDTIIIQEPEQSLHPKVQTKLADFFLAMALSEKQCLIETHSEYIIEQLCYRILSSDDRKMHEKTIKLYDVTKRDGVSHYSEIKTNEVGGLEKLTDITGETHKIMMKKLDMASNRANKEEDADSE